MRTRRQKAPEVAQKVGGMSNMLDYFARNHEIEPPSRIWLKIEEIPWVDSDGISVFESSQIFNQRILSKVVRTYLHSVLSETGTQCTVSRSHFKHPPRPHL